MNEYNNEKFEHFKNRYFEYLLFVYHKNLLLARDKDFSKKLQKVFYDIFSDETLDDFSLNVATIFNMQYKMGLEIAEIIKNLKEMQSHYLQNHDANKTVSFKEEYFKLLGFKTIFLKSITYFNAKGEETSRTEYDYTFSFKTLRKLIKAKTDQEKLDIYMNEIHVKKQSIGQGTKCVTEIIDPNEHREHKWFKALVKYQGRQEFSAFLEKEITGNKLTTTKKNIIKPDNIKEVVKWTNGRNNNDFVKLIYTLYEAKLINNGKGEITKIVESLAPVFGIELKNWQSNFSKGIHEQSINYDHSAFFEKLTETYVKYQKEKMKNKKN